MQNALDENAQGCYYLEALYLSKYFLYMYSDNGLNFRMGSIGWLPLAV
jgi:hypothetical protein